MTASSLPPIHRSITVSWDPAAAFRRFTAEFASWWPVPTHSIGGKRVKRIIFEQRVGGLIFEEHLDGRRFQWGEVLEWNPPEKVRFAFHPSRGRANAQDVEVRFVPDGTGTRLEMTVTGWERWGAGAERARRGYNLGWKYILNVWAGRRTATMALVDLMSVAARGIERLKGDSRDRAGGEIAPAEPERS